MDYLCALWNIVFLPWEVILGGFLTIACLVGSYLCGRKAKKLEEEKKKQEEQKVNAKVR